MSGRFDLLPPGTLTSSYLKFSFWGNSNCTTKQQIRLIMILITNRPDVPHRICSFMRCLLHRKACNRAVLLLPGGLFLLRKARARYLSFKGPSGGSTSQRFVIPITLETKRAPVRRRSSTLIRNFPAHSYTGAKGQLWAAPLPRRAGSAAFISPFYLVAI